MLRACARAFERQHELSRREDNVISFARTPQDDDDDDFYGNAKKSAGTAAGLAAAAGAGYLGYKGYQAWRNRGNGTGPDNGITGPGSRPLLPPGPSGGGSPRTPRDPNGSAENIDVGNGEGSHPTAPSTSRAITTASSTTRKTVGNSVVDPLADAVASGRRKIAQKGSAIWRALKSVPLE
jgi:hypothetical protein